MAEWTPEDLAILKKLTGEGASRSRIAAKVGRSTTAVVAVAKLHGIRLKSFREVRREYGLSPNWSDNRAF